MKKNKYYLKTVLVLFISTCLLVYLYENQMPIFCKHYLESDVMKNIYADILFLVWSAALLYPYRCEIVDLIFKVIQYFEDKSRSNKLKCNSEHHEDGENIKIFMMRFPQTPNDSKKQYIVKVYLLFEYPNQEYKEMLERANIEWYKSNVLLSKDRSSALYNPADIKFKSDIHKGEDFAKYIKFIEQHCRRLIYTQEFNSSSEMYKFLKSNVYDLSLRIIKSPKDGDAVTNHKLIYEEVTDQNHRSFGKHIDEYNQKQNIL